MHDNMRLAPVPAPSQVLHVRTVEHELDTAFAYALDADDRRDERAAPANNPAQLTLDLRP